MLFLFLFPLFFHKLRFLYRGKCSWTKEFSNKNSFDFGDYLADSLTNPLYKEYYPTWPVSFVLFMPLTSIKEVEGGILVWACPCVCPLRFVYGQERLETGS